jgi:hypothetical protein
MHPINPFQTVFDLLALRPGQALYVNAHEINHIKF